jgi:lipopolysaccharide export system ATP-binding protein
MSESNGSLLRAEGLVKAFRRRVVVRDVSVEVRQGEIVGLLGPNGAGKTTTFYLITGLIQPDTGRIYLDGNELTNAPMFRRARAGIGYLAQEPSVFRRLTVEQNVMAILETLDLPRDERRRRLERLLDELSIAHLRKSRAYSLSGGERRRLEITRALVTNAEVHAARRAVRRRGPDRGTRHPDDRRLAARPRDRRADHRSQRRADAGDRGPRLHHVRGQRPGAAGTVRELVWNDRVAELYLGPTLTARLRAGWRGPREDRPPSRPASGRSCASILASTRRWTCCTCR